MLSADTIVRARSFLTFDPTARRAQYDLCINALVLDGYDRRGMTDASASVGDNPALRRILTQLKLTEPVFNLDT